MSVKKQEAVGPTKEQAQAEAAAREAFPKTGEGTHVAIRRGYAAGDLIEDGGEVPAGVPVSDVWMTEK